MNLMEVPVFATQSAVSEKIRRNFYLLSTPDTIVPSC